MGKIKIGILAGEASGDELAAGLMRALVARLEGTQDTVCFYGVGGPAMDAVGMHHLVSIDEITTQGFFDPLIRLPSLLKSYNQLVKQFIKLDIDVFIGVDFNGYNLKLEKRLRDLGIRTVHYVSPSVYAWRQGRVKQVAAAAHQLLCLFPFEPKFYEGYAIDARFVGHPAADDIPQEPITTEEACSLREEYGWSDKRPLLVVLPGSRHSELRYNLPVMLEALKQFRLKAPEFQMAICLGHDKDRVVFERVLSDLAIDLNEIEVDLVVERTISVMRLADIGLIKNGTSTLQALCCRLPMVTGYRLGRVTAWIIMKLLITDRLALPNILSADWIVPELLQEQFTAERVVEELVKLWSIESTDSGSTTSVSSASAAAVSQLEAFADLHKQLAFSAHERACDAVLSLLSTSNG